MQAGSFQLLTALKGPHIPCHVALSIFKAINRAQNFESLTLPYATS